MCGVADVCSITDVDEFLRPLEGRSDICTAVAEIFSKPEVSAVGLSWTTYGSSGRVEPGEGLVIERFTRRAPSDRNRCAKTIVRPERFAETISPHKVKTVGGLYVDDRGGPIRWTSPGGTECASWNSLRVDHFVLKSRREFEAKARRGRADASSGVTVRDEAFFASRDRNEVLDPMPADFVDWTKTELRRLQDYFKHRV